MTKRMLIDASHPEETRVVVADGTRIEELDFESSAKRQLRGNVYLARVTRVEPSLQAAFVEYGGNRHGFLAFSEIHPDYYQIPYEDRMALLEAEEADALADAKDEDEEAEKTAQASSNDDAATSDDMDDDTDTDDEDDAAAEQAEPAKKRRRSSSRRRYKIQEVIKRGQILLIQVVKEERGNKGAAMTTYLSLAGRYCVLMPNTPRGGGISRKIANGPDRKRLKTIVADLKVPSGIGVIVRTAGAKRTKPEIKRDYEYLSRLWETIRDKTLKSIAPSLIHEEGDLVKRSIRDLYDKDISEILVQGDEAYKDAKSFIKMLMPSHAKNVKAYKETIPLFLRYNIESQLEDSLSSLVQLKSGGYLVIHPTEALVSIDVNSGRSTKERNVERTALKTNLEAVDEVARQMRLRDLAGLVVIDFIDMDENKNNRAVERRMKEALSRDRARVQTGRISQFGLMEISRQRRRRSLLDASTISCPHCSGVGRQRSTESTALRALRAVAETGVRGKAARIRLRITPDVALYMINEKRNRLQEIEQTYNMFVELYADGELLKPDFTIDVLESRTSETGDPMTEIEKEHKRERQESDREAAKAKKKKTSDDKDKKDSEAERSESVSEDDEDQPRRRRRRGRRGGRRRRGEGGEGAEGAEAQTSAEADQSATEPSGLEVIETGGETSGDTEQAKPKRRGRRKAPSGKAKTDDAASTDNTASPDEQTAPKAKRSGRRKAPSRNAAAEVDAKEETRVNKRTSRKAPEAAPSDDKAASKPSPRSTSRRAAPTRKAADISDAPAKKAKAAPKRKVPAKAARPDTAKAPASTARRKAPARKHVAETNETDVKAAKPARRKAAPKPKTAEVSETAKDDAKPKRTRKAPAKKAAPKAQAAKATASGTAKPASRRKAPAKPAAPKAATSKAATSDTPKPKRTRKAPVKAAAAKAKAAPKAKAAKTESLADKTAKADAVDTPRTRKAPTRQSAKVETPASLSSDVSPAPETAQPVSSGDTTAKKGKKRNWLQRLTGLDKE